MHRLTILAALFAMVALLAGCQEQDPLVDEADQVPEELADQAESDDEEDGGNGGGDAETTVEFTADDMVFEDLPDSVEAGVVEFVMDNQGASEHDMTIEELGDETVVELTPGGESGSGTVELEPGTYTVYCSVPGHREAGMEAEIAVE